MTPTPFASPAPPSGGITWADHLGRLLVVEPVAAETIKTVHGDSDAVRAHVHVIDGPAPQSFDDALVFPRVLAAQLRPRLGQKVLGRLGQGQAKPGQSAPWVILDADEADTATAVAWLDRDRAAAFTTAAAPAASARPPF